jgi:hypothetical protein
VALVLQWRQDYPNKLPPKLAAVASEMGHNLPPALQKNFVGQEIVPFQTSEQTDMLKGRAVLLQLSSVGVLGGRAIQIINLTLGRRMH